MIWKWPATCIKKERKKERKNSVKINFKNKKGRMWKNQEIAWSRTETNATKQTHRDCRQMLICHKIQKNPNRKKTPILQTHHQKMILSLLRRHIPRRSNFSRPVLTMRPIHARLVDLVVLRLCGHSELKGSLTATLFACAHNAKQGGTRCRTFRWSTKEKWENRNQVLLQNSINYL